MPCNSAPTSCTRQLAAASSAGPPPLSFPLFFFFGQGFFGAGASVGAFVAGVLGVFLGVPNLALQKVQVSKIARIGCDPGRIA